jgi:hypothetical protein
MIKKKHSILFAVGVSLHLMVIAPPWIYASQVLFIQIEAEEGDMYQKVELATRFYGLDIDRFPLHDQTSPSDIITSIKRRGSYHAIVVTPDALKAMDASTINDINPDIPFLLMGITPHNIDQESLAKWSGGSLLKCVDGIDGESNASVTVTPNRDLVQELAGQKIPYHHRNGYLFSIAENAGCHTIFGVGNTPEGKTCPIFVVTKMGEREFFFAVQMESPVENENRMAHFVWVVPVMVFLKHACGDYCWHSPGNYANLTIDDPWLTEPYGHLSYKGLLEEMQEASFHTTIAFIPWNFDRSMPEVVSLFREHPERFSICIHGNNHDHYEFYKYTTTVGDPWPAKPLNVQEANIKQALARMAAFSRLTHLPHDRVMVFPHGIAPAKTLHLLKQYNFLATANAGNVPLDSEGPPDPLFQFRPATLEFGNFPSLNRYTPTRSEPDIAVDLFLDNPLLFYTHHEFFENGIDAFNETARMINKIQPDIGWHGLGYIAQHLYLEKLKKDGDYDLKAFASDIVIENTHQKEVTFFVHKEESFSPPIKRLTVDGLAYPYSESAKGLISTLSIPAGESRHLIIEYENNLNVASIDVSKKDSHVNRLRKLSDFRDMTLARNMFGRAFIYLYYEVGLFKMVSGRFPFVFLVLAIFMASGGWYLRRRYMRMKS